MNIFMPILLTLASFTPLYCMEQKKLDVIIDPCAIFEPNPVTAAQEIGIWNLCGTFLSSIWGGPKITEAIPQFFTVLKNIDPQKCPEPVMWHGHQAPFLLHQFLTQPQQSDYFYENVTNGIKKQLLNNESLMLSYAKITFDPITNTRVMSTVAGALALLQDLSKEDHAIHLAGNWNKEAFEKLQQKFPEVFALVQGKKAISGNEGIVKSYQLYDQFFKKHTISPENSIFIEAEPSNTDYFNALLPKEKLTMLYTSDGFNAIRQELSKKGILPFDKSINE